MVAILMGLAAALGTLLGLFVGMPAVGYLLWPLTRAACRVACIEIDPHDEHDPVMKLEGSLAAGLGMALGVFAAVALVGLVAAAGESIAVPRALLAAAAAGGIAGTSFGGLWRYGYRGRSVAPLLSATALAAGLVAGGLAW
jgi:hypothetical protein